MEAPFTTHTASKVPVAHPIELCLDNLRDEITTLVQNETTYKQALESLQTELSAFKRAYTEVNAELKTAKMALVEVQQANVHLRDEVSHRDDKGNRVVMLIDGDGAIFSTQLISQGQKGGHVAARRLSDETMQTLTENFGARMYQLWVYVFFNKQGLLNTLRRCGFAALTNKLDEFVIGFNQATERFIMVDVGSTKEAADAKLKGYLEDEIRLSETFKVIFGGCHDNGYVANLHSQITAGYKEKLILLKGYADIAFGIASLDLPIITIPELFLKQKFSDGPSREIDPKLPVIKQKPPPCIAFYLKKGCSAGASCNFCHDYVLTDDQRDEFRKAVKKTVCPVANKGKVCQFGEDCCYGHQCPTATNCFFLKRGNCRFKQENMHINN
ncbi:hypothetical protein MIND_00312700 [Mycena indigotica]|uniref:C3H1-type domain-containing protein n=1 Tax=Mycena indigotica TaxID=2126181 RepID=A0A8H6W883_9AGAR|nr:uncharacterized protein MIND_00312700 [Mycena indigotica]KAF7309419.1 hypothetical protein MIND_00312700 [Mycena indigotica]